MLGNSKMFASFSTNNLEDSKNFYVNKLGLKIQDEFPGGISFKSVDGTRFMIYEKGKEHQPATFTVLNFEVEDVEKYVDELRALGIEMEQYPQLNTNDKGISRNEEMDMGMAWFKDPAGNIIGIMQLVD